MAISIDKNNLNTQSMHFQKKRKANNNFVSKNPKEKLNQIYRSQGYIGKFFDKLHGVLGIGYSKKKLKKELKNPNIDEKLNKYYDQQKNSTEIACDTIVGLSAAGVYKLAKKAQVYSHLYTKNKKFELISSGIGIGISAISAMFMKPIFKSINSIGTPKKERKQERTIMKDMGTGLIDGLASPLIYMHKLGILAAVGINSLSRFIFNKKADKNSDFSDFVANSWLAKGLGIGIAGFSAFKFHKRINVLEKAIVKSKENIKNIQVFKGKMPLTELADLAITNIKDTQTQSELLAATKRGFFSKIYMTVTKPIRKVLKKPISPQVGLLEFLPTIGLRKVLKNKNYITDKELNNIMREIEQYNIFYPKMIQSMPSNIESMITTLGGKSDAIGDEKIIKTLNNFLNKYKSNCPASRTAKEAQEYIQKTYGNKYQIIGKNPLGVGTIAETFLAKDTETGKEVVIKMVKKWVSADKINKDKEHMLTVLERAKDKLKPDEYNYQKKLIDNLYEAWSKEVNLSLEAEAAETLGKYAQHYNTVAPISVKNNIFVMEKANGVQFDKFTEYLDKNNITLTRDEANQLMINYFKVFFEQLLSVPKKGGKVMHADPHAGNIFIDYKNKTKPFTFIDTGNVMRFTPEEAIQNVTSHIDYLIGNSKNIATRLLKNAQLPDNVTEKQAIEMLSKHLDETFYSGKYKIHSDPFSTINNESIDFMKKNKIILNSQNTNLLKAELTYLVNLISVGNIVKHIDKNSVTNQLEMERQMKLMGKQILTSIYQGAINNKRCTFKELYSRYKYFKKNPEKIFTTMYTYVPPNNI